MDSRAIKTPPLKYGLKMNHSGNLIKNLSDYYENVVSSFTLLVKSQRGLKLSNMAFEIFPFWMHRKKVGGQLFPAEDD